MATKSVRKLAETSNQVGGMNVSGFERNKTAFGVIEASSYSIGDVLSFDYADTNRIIDARITTHEVSPVTLEILPGTDLTNPIQLNVAAPVKLSYVINYVKGAGRSGFSSSGGEGQLLRIEIV
jgi:hypothetical protein